MRRTIFAVTVVLASALAAHTVACSSARERAAVDPPEDAGSPPDAERETDSAAQDMGSPAADSGRSDDSGNPSDAGEDSPWATVEPIFMTYCAQCHASAWEDCPIVQLNAQNIEYEVSSGDMPRNGPMPAAARAAILGFLDAGAPCPPGDDDASVDAGSGDNFPPATP
jgi:hypothetical protein